MQEYKCSHCNGLVLKTPDKRFNGEVRCSHCKKVMRFKDGVEYTKEQRDLNHIQKKMFGKGKGKCNL